MSIRNSAASAVVVKQDLSTFTESTPEANGTITLAVNSITLGTVDNINSQYVSKDYVAGFFRGAVAYYFTTNFSAGTDFTRGRMAGLAMEDVVKPDNAVYLYHEGSSGAIVMRLGERYLGTDYAVAGQSNAMTNGVNYYHKIVLGATTIAWSLYSDPERRVLIKTITLTLQARLNYQFFHLFEGLDGGVNNGDISGVLSDLIIIKT